MKHFENLKKFLKEIQYLFIHLFILYIFMYLFSLSLLNSYLVQSELGFGHGK